MTVFNRSRPSSQLAVTGHDNDNDEEYAQKGLVAPRYMGTQADQRDMNALGRVQVLRVRPFPFQVTDLALLTLSSEIFDLFPLLVLDVP
jgi:hypothetical protein